MALGLTRVCSDYGGIPYTGTVTKFCTLWFRVVFTDGDSADYNGHELEPPLDLSGERLLRPANVVVLPLD